MKLSILAAIFIALCTRSAISYITQSPECLNVHPSLKSNCADGDGDIDIYECENMKYCCWDDETSTPGVPECFRIKSVTFQSTTTAAPGNFYQPGTAAPYNPQQYNPQSYNPQPQQPGSGSAFLGGPSQQQTNNQNPGQSGNLNNLLSSLGVGQTYQNPQQGQQGALGTWVPAPSQAPVPQQTSDGNKLIKGLGTQCELANSITNEATRQTWIKKLGCTGLEKTIDKEKAEQVVQNLFGGILTPNQNQPGSGAVGSLLPTYGVQPARPANVPRPANTGNAQICNLLSNANLGNPQLLAQYGCGKTGGNNNLGNLLGGNIPSNLPGLPSLLTLLGGDNKKDEGVKEGAINPDKIPYEILNACFEKVDTYPSCRTGNNIGIYSSVECFNHGCIFFNNRCFRCNKVPSSAYINQDNAETCAVAQARKAECPGYKKIQLSTLLFSQQGGGGFNPYGGGGLGGTAGLLSALGGGSGGSSAALTQALLGGSGNSGNLFSSLLGGSNSNPFGNLFQRAATPAPQTYQPTPPPSRVGSLPRTRQYGLSSFLGGGSSGINPLLLQGLTGGSSSSTGGINNLLLQSLAGGNSGSSGSSGLLSLLYGGDSGGLPGIGEDTTRALRTACENRGCCWFKGGLLGGNCYAKGTTFTKNCIPTKESGTCGKSPVTTFQRIIGGSSVGSNTHRPWMAMIKLAGQTNVRCGGVLICSQWILTTASCLKKVQSVKDNLIYLPSVDVSHLDVWLGTLDPVFPQTTGTKAIINEIVFHPQYSTRQSYNDVALIKIRSVAFDSRRKPACLPPLGDTGPAADTVVGMTGYGETGDSRPHSTLKELQLTVKTQGFCRGEYDSAIPLSGVFCAKSASGSDSCYGDGGSPVMQYDSGTDTFTVVGLNYGGSDKCDGSKPSLFTKISTFIPWIAQTTNGCCSLPGSREG